MRVIDIEVGQKYRVKVNVVPFFKQGAVVQVLWNDNDNTVFVQDLSKQKYGGGRWHTLCSYLAPLKGIDPEEIKVGLRVKHKELGVGTVIMVTDRYLQVEWDKPLAGICKIRPFSRGKRFYWDKEHLWSCEELSIIDEKDSVLDGLQKKLNEDLFDALYYSLQRRCAEDIKELKALNEQKLEGHREGNKIIFTLVKGDKTIEASASCSPNDTFDYITGSQIALARLAQKCGKPAKVYLPKDTKDFQIEFI